MLQRGRTGQEGVSADKGETLTLTGHETATKALDLRGNEELQAELEQHLKTLAAQGQTCARASADERSVSVIVPTYNRAAMLEECVHSLLQQSVPPAQIIIVDDGSQDDTGDRVQRLSRRFDNILYVRKDNGGKPQALNMALPMVTSEWVWLFDDDDVALPDAIERRFAVLETMPQARVILSNHVWGRTGDDGKIVRTTDHQWPHVTAQNMRLLLMRSCFASLCGALVHASCYREVGGFREELLRSQDYEMLLRLVRRYPVALVDEPSFIVRRHDGVRGPESLRFDESKREQHFVHHDRIVGRALRREAQLGEYLVPPSHAPLTPGLQRLALANRMTVMAGKGLEEDMIEDARQLATLIDESPEQKLLAEEQRLIIKAGQQRYMGLRLVQNPAAFYVDVDKLCASPSGRSIVKCLSLGIARAARWERSDNALRRKLFGASFQLYLRSLPTQTLLRLRRHFRKASHH